MRWVLVLVVAALLGSCSGLSTAVKAVGAVAAKPGVSANVQAGKHNSQTIGASQTNDQKISDVTAQTIKQSSGNSTVEAAEVQTVVVNQYPAWLILAFAAALFLDSPLRWPGQIYRGLLGRGGSK